MQDSELDALRLTPARRRALDEALKWALGLPIADMAVLHERVTAFLNASGHAYEAKLDRGIRERLEAIDALRAAAGHLAPREAAAKKLTIREYREAANALGLALSTQQVVRRWGRWTDANRELVGEAVSETPEQRFARGGFTPGVRPPGRPRSKDPVRSLQEFMASGEPRSVSGYNDWARRANRAIEDQSDRYPYYGVVYDVLAVPFEVAISIADPENPTTIDDARSAYLERLKTTSGPLGLCNTQGVALVRDEPIYESRRLAAADELPPRAAMLNDSRVWRFEDIEAHAAGKPVADHDPDYLQDALLSSASLAEVLKRGEEGVWSAVHRNSLSVPQPDGRAGKYAYWLRTEVERWVSENADLLGLEGAQLTAALKRRRKASR